MGFPIPRGSVFVFAAWLSLAGCSAQTCVLAESEALAAKYSVYAVVQPADPARSFSQAPSFGLFQGVDQAILLSDPTWTTVPQGMVHIRVLPLGGTCCTGATSAAVSAGGVLSTTAATDTDGNAGACLLVFCFAHPRTQRPRNRNHSPTVPSVARSRGAGWRHARRRECRADNGLLQDLRCRDGCTVQRQRLHIAPHRHCDGVREHANAASANPSAEPAALADTVIAAHAAQAAAAARANHSAYFRLQR